MPENGTKSPTLPTNTPPEQQAVTESLSKSAANNRLLQLAGIESIVNGMEWEQKRTDAWSREAHEAVWGEGTAGDEAATGEDEMRMLVGGDVNFGQPPTPGPEAEQQPVAPARPKERSALGAAALVAATVLGGGLSGAALSGIGSDESKFTDTRNITEFGIGSADAANP